MIILGGVAVVGGLVIWMASTLGRAASDLSDRILYGGSGSSERFDATGIIIGTGVLGAGSMIAGFVLVARPCRARARRWGARLRFPRRRRGPRSGRDPRDVVTPMEIVMSSRISFRHFRGASLRMALVASLAVSTAHAQATSEPAFSIELEPGMTAVIRGRGHADEVRCQGVEPCRALSEPGGTREVELSWGGAHADRRDRVSIAPAPLGLYRSRWVNRSDERAMGATLLVLSPFIFVGFGFGALAACDCLASSGNLGALAGWGGLGIAAFLGSVIGGSYLAGLRDHASLELVPGVTASLYLDVTQDRGVAGIGGTF